MWRAEVPDHLTALFVVLGRVGHDEAGLPAVGPHVFRTGLGRASAAGLAEMGLFVMSELMWGSCARVNSSRYPVTTYVLSATCTTGVFVEEPVRVVAVLVLHRLGPGGFGGGHDVSVSGLGSAGFGAELGAPRGRVVAGENNIGNPGRLARSGKRADIGSMSLGAS